MTTAIRVIASMLLDPARGVIKGKQFAHDRVIGEPIQWARVMSQIREVDELVVFDVTHGPPNLQLLRRINAECTVPLAYGGGIHDVDIAVEIVRACAEKVIVKDDWLIPDIVQRLGAQAVVGCIDEVDGCNYRAQHLVNRGAGEILLQSRERDGTLSGYDFGALGAVRDVVSVPVIVSSGAGTVEHFIAAAAAGADGLAAGAIWQFTDTTPKDVKVALRAAGYDVRLEAAA